MKVAPQKTLTFGKRRVDYRLVRSKSARKLRVRVGPEGVEVVQPVGRTTEEFEAFLESRQDWIIRQIERVERFRSVRKPLRKERGEILYRGKPTLVRVEDVPRHRGTNRVLFEADGLVVIRGRRSRTSPAQSLENWLRKQARQEIHRHLDRLTVRIGRHPRRVYVMGQRTKWGNCSSLQNLSFNWRLIMAPDFVLRYLVTHGRFMYLCWVLPPYVENGPITLKLITKLSDQSQDRYAFVPTEHRQKLDTVHLPFPTYAPRKPRQKAFGPEI